MSHDDATIRKKARDLLQSGLLPARRPDGIWAVPGSGRYRCLVCGDLVPPEEFAIEVEFRGADGSSSLYFHVGCFWALESERHPVEPAPDSTDHPGKPWRPGRADRQRWLERSPK